MIAENLGFLKALARQTGSPEAAAAIAELASRGLDAQGNDPAAAPVVVPENPLEQVDVAWLKITARQTGSPGCAEAIAELARRGLDNRGQAVAP